MTDWLVAILTNFPKPLATVILATFPFTESRLAIPIALGVWQLPPLSAFGWSLIGNLLPFFPLYFGLDAIRAWSKRYSPWLSKFIDYSIDRAQNKIRKKYARYGALALCLFTAIPLPLTGLYSATIAAVTLKIPVRYAFVGIGLGVVIAGIIVTVLTAGVKVMA